MLVPAPSVEAAAAPEPIATGNLATQTERSETYW